MSYQGYVVGLMFRNGRSEVALIRKNRPKWQAGLWNGVGGKIEPGELPDRAMVREFKEETGCDTSVDFWWWFAKTEWPEGAVYYFTCESDGAELRSVTDEEVDWVKVADLPQVPVVPNLRWVIPMAMCRYNEYFNASVDYGRDPLAKMIAEAKAA